MEVKYEVVRPNLYVVGDRIFFGINGSNFIQVCRDVDRIVSEHIGELKVQEPDLEVVEEKRFKSKDNDYKISLADFLDAIEKRNLRSTSYRGITTRSAGLFGLDYLIYAKTYRSSSQDFLTWTNLHLQRDLSDPNPIFDEWERDYPMLILDREKTLEEMKKLYLELDGKMPENYAEFILVDGSNEIITGDVGLVSVKQVKAVDRTQVEKCKSQLVDRLKEVDGPCLSYDVPNIVSQTIELSNNATSLVQQYGDILLNPDWKKRLFRLDP